MVIVIRRIPLPQNAAELGQNCHYQVTVTRQREIDMFGPPLPYPAIFEHGPRFRSWLLYKAVNGELTAYRSPLFIKQLRLGFRSQLEDLAGRYYQAREATFADNALKSADQALKSAGRFFNSKVSVFKKEKDK